MYTCAYNPWHAFMADQEQQLLFAESPHFVRKLQLTCKTLFHNLQNVRRLPKHCITPLIIYISATIQGKPSSFKNINMYKFFLAGLELYVVNRFTGLLPSVISVERSPNDCSSLTCSG